MKKILVLCFVLVLVAMGCTGRSVCTDREFDSKLCDTADSIGISLETVGNVLIVANAIAIGEGLYTATQAVTVLKDLQDINNRGVSYLFLRGEIKDILSKYPGLFTVSLVYLNSFGSPQIMYAKDKDIIDYWLDQQIDMLGG